MRDSLIQDVSYAFRNLGRSPLFAGAAILTMALGIGANTAIFSVIDETLFRPLAFPHPEQLADVFSFNKASRTFVSSSYPEYEDFRNRARSFRYISAFVRMPLNVETGGILNARVPVEAVTGNYFSMLEFPPLAGRVLRDEDDLPGAAPVAMISAAMAGSGAVGARILVEEQPFTVVGIVGKSYRGTNLNWGEAPRVWIPLQATALVRPRLRTLDIFRQRQMQWLVITGRLKTGATVAGAQAELQTIDTADRDVTAVVFSASRAKFWPAYRESVTRSLVVFAVAAGLVLLLACANVSNLLISRAVGRKREFAIRLALGASGGRLVRQLLTESLLLAVPSAALALGTGVVLDKVLLHFPNALGLPLVLDPGLESRVLLFCLGLTLAATILFGLAPAMEAARTAVLPSLKESGNTLSGGGRDWLRNLLVVAQVAFSTILLVGGGLFARSVLKAWSFDAGFRAEGLLTASFNVPIPGASSMGRFRRDRQLLMERLRLTPGIDDVTTASNPPLNPLHFRTSIQAGATTLTVDRQTAGPDFFRTMGIPLAGGREFNAGDDAGSPKVAIVNQTLAARLWPGVNPLGQILLVQKVPIRIAGIARDSRYGSVWEDPQPTLYEADAQSDAPAGYLIVRSGERTDKLTPTIVKDTIVKEWGRISPRVPLYDFLTSDEQMNLALAPQRMAAGILGAFGILAIVLAAIGLYSLIACTVARRTREIGIRMAIGASPRLVVRQIMGRSMAMAGIGVAAGAGIARLLVPYVTGMVKGISVYDGVTFGAVALLLGVVAFAAAAVPARRAARIDPGAALRFE